jgi:cytosine/adenosine deaminase-related metal-dependent hydrolase/ubiquinone/menaquinone biosynthesis C-methylase UbiE
VGASFHQFAAAKAGEFVSTISEVRAGNAKAFAAWAEVYDQETNPLLTLEERYLKRLLPELSGKDVLDVGCGTGRWLSRLATAGAASIQGVDGSAEMLAIAARKHMPGVRLTRAALPSLPVPSASADLILVSYVLSYVQDLVQSAFEFARITRHGGDVFISDMHPDTAASLGWKRGFNSLAENSLHVEQRAINEVIDVFASNGFELATCIEPAFGEIELELFEARGKQAAWRQANELPAIYLLQFRRQVCIRRTTGNTMPDLHLHSNRCALGPSELVPGSVVIEDGSIQSLISSTTLTLPNAREGKCIIDLNGYLLFPGLVNSHDHLEFGLFPRLGKPPYQNATDWAWDIQKNEAELIALHKRVPKDVRLYWGGIRNLLCGVTTVCHHNPLEPVLHEQDFPVRVLREYGWAHSTTFGLDIADAMRRTGPNEPFLIHACEGIDRNAAEELRALEDLGALNERTVIVHGLALDLEGSDLLNRRRAALVVCPSSNKFLFEKTHTDEFLRSVQRIAMGSDSPITADGDLLDEIRFTKSTCHMRLDELYAMVTDRAARILRVCLGEGTLRAKSVADLFAVRHRDGSPAEILTELCWRDVELVVVGGRVRLASSNVFNRLPAETKRDLVSLEIEGEIRWLCSPIPTLLDEAERVLGAGNLRLGRLRIARVEAGSVA